MKRNSAENKVRKILKESGFDLNKQKDQTHQGVDIVAMKGGEVLLIEVKKATRHNRAWQVDAVSKKQAIVSDIIAIVTPTHVVFQPMKEHLKLCSPNGMRYVTELVGMCKIME
jgi:predicted RecB family endonuclease